MNADGEHIIDLVVTTINIIQPNEDALIVSGKSKLNDDVNITGDLDVSGTVNLSSTTNSTSTSTGALIVAGGVGIGNDLYTKNANVKNLLTIGSGGTSYNFPITKGTTNQVLTMGTGSGLIFSTVSGGGGTPTEIIDTITDVQTSTSYIQITSMTTTPASGTYIVFFSCSCSGNTTNQQIDFAIHKNTTIIQSSHRFQNWSIQNAMSSMRNNIISQAVVTVNGTDTINVRVRTNTGNVTIYERSLIIK